MVMLNYAHNGILIKKDTKIHVLFINWVEVYVFKHIHLYVVFVKQN